jgi:hypothetical protein
MSSFPPPNVYFNGIIYDSQFFEIPALTLSQANAKYLRKTFPDTATAQETFNNGIKTNDIAPTASSLTVQLFQNSTTGNANMFNGQTSGTLTIGGNSSRTGGVLIANGTRGDISIGNAMNAGTNIIRIGTSGTGTLSLRGANVKVGEGSNTNVELGSTSTTTITLFKALTPSYLPSTILSTNIGYKLAFTALSLTLSPNVAKSMMSVSLTAGVWLLQATIQTPTPATYQGLCFSTTTNVMDYTLSASQIITDGFFPMALNICYVASVSATTPYYMVAIAGDMRTLTQRTGSATRLA